MSRLFALFSRRLGRNRMGSGQDRGTMTYVFSMMMMT